MHLGFQTHSAHAHRFVDTFLAVDHELLCQHVQDLLIGRDRHGACRFDHRIDIACGHFVMTNRHDSYRIEAANMRTGDADVCRAYPAVGHQLSGFDRTADRLHRALDVDHHTFFQALGRMPAHANNLDAAIDLQFADQRGDLGGADIQANQVFGSGMFAHDLGFSPTRAVAGGWMEAVLVSASAAQSGRVPPRAASAGAAQCCARSWLNHLTAKPLV